ncbi:uncharacterized protein LOC110024977 [Phalaenopsis equestris]|uniref:uncharacterized protein LOC110024977 n=1 Tax=Phalaenopsis equestris TaxID=78828 RepID=UPI0009E60D6D|nr:uncharacterized protein LOC110024977 [Phalaenopsis equestris]
MSPVIHCSIGNINLFPGTTFSQTNIIQFTRYNALHNAKRIFYARRYDFPQPSLHQPQIYRISFASRHGLRSQTVSAVGTDVTVEDPNPAVSEEGDDVAEGSLPSSVETSKTVPSNPAITPTTRVKRPRSVRKSEMPPVKDEELIPGASFIGKVRSIQPFGAFVDFGAFTDGLVHVSRISDDFVKDVAAVVSIGQEVKVKVVEANKETGRISLTMRDGDDTIKTQQRKETPANGSSDKPRSVRKNSVRSNQKRDEVQKSSKLVKGQVLVGTVKNTIRSGAFVSLPDGEEGFLPVSEESEGFGNLTGNSSLQVGQEVKVRVLRISRGQATLTMKKEEDVESINRQLNQGVVHVATNPFELAFRQNKDIAAFLDERERKQRENSRVIEEKVNESTTSSEEDKVCISSESDLGLDVGKSRPEVIHEEAYNSESVPDEQISGYVELAGESPLDASSIPKTSTEDVDNFETLKESSNLVSDELSEIDVVADLVSVGFTNDESISSTTNLNSESFVVADGSSSNEEEQNVVSNQPTYKDKLEIAAIEVNGNVGFSNAESSVADGIPITNEVEGSTIPVITVSEGEENFQNPDANQNGIKELETFITVELKENEVRDLSVTQDEGCSKGLTNEESQKREFFTPENFITVEFPATNEDKETDDSAITFSEESDARSEVGPAKSEEFSEQASGEILVSEVAHEEIASKQPDVILINSKMETEESPLIENEIASSSNGIKREALTLETPETSVEKSGNPDQGSAVKATISPSVVKQLREETGAGMMDCKKALAATDGDIVKAQEFLRKKGLATADNKASRSTAEGRIGSYVHDNRIGVLVEVNCETDFVSRGEIFQQLVEDLAMQVAACPQVRCLVPEDIPDEIVNKEREIEMQKEDLMAKPEQIRSKIVDGRIKKRLAEFALLEQPYIKNDKLVVKDWVKQTIATLGENIKVKRFVRYNLGEGLEKKSQNFAAEVAAQTAAKPSSSVLQDQSSAAKETRLEKPPTAVISAALVKQLREETGAGMMDCKKALSETGGNLERAQEYLRKKGLSSADKKSSRLAAEGRISSYVHDSRIGCLIEVNSETDFVGRNEKFIELVDDLAMQVVACPQVEFVSVEDIPESLVNREREVEMQREDLQSKPEVIREKIVEGRISKRLGELALLEQTFIKNDSLLVKDLVKQTVAALGENIRVRRFIRYTLGEVQD